MMLILLLLLLVPAQILLWQPNLYQSYDILTHIDRAAEMNSALSWGQFPARLAPNILHGLGVPLFVVNYQLAYYLAQVPLAVTHSPELAVKFVLSATYVLSAIFAWLFFHRLSGSKLAALTAAIVFSYTPYRFANLYFRGSLPEATALMFVPLIFYALSASRYKLLAIGIFGLIASHALIFAIFFPLILAYLWSLTSLRSKIYHLRSLLVGILMASFQTLPAVFEKQYIHFERLFDIYKTQFISFPALFRLPLGGANIGYPLQAGIVVFFLLLAGYHHRFWLIPAILATLLILPQSAFIWDRFPPLQYLLYSWRLISVITFCAAAIAAILTKSRPWLAPLLIVTIIFTSRHYYLKTNYPHENYVTPTLSVFAENDPIWMTDKTLSLTTDNHQPPFDLQYSFNFNQLTTYTFPRLYFPGWKLTLNASPHPIFPQEGLITATIPAGSYSTRLYFTETPLRKLANSLSLTGFAAWILLL